MLIPLRAAQFNDILRIGGRMYNKVIDPSRVGDKGTELFATDNGVVVRAAGVEALVGWATVQHAEAANGFSFVNGRTLPTMALPTPGTEEKAVVVQEGPPPIVEPAKRSPGRPKKQW